jgi:hypothetical protein
VQHEILPDETYALPDSQGTNYQLNIANAGRYDLVLDAKRNDEIVTESLVLFVEPRLEIDIATSNVTESVDEQPYLFRNVEQTMTISWSVEWTANPGQDSRQPPTIILNSLPLGYDQQNVPPESPPQVITVRPTNVNSIVLTLFSNGPEDIQTSLEQEITVLDPVCNTTASAVDIYAGPALEGFPLLLSIPPSTLRVQSRVTDADWVRVYLPPGSNLQREFGWVQAEMLTCAFDIDALLISENIPAPSRPSPTGTPVPPSESDALPATDVPAQG